MDLDNLKAGPSALLAIAFISASLMGGGLIVVLFESTATGFWGGFLTVAGVMTIAATLACAVGSVVFACTAVFKGINAFIDLTW